MTLSSVIKSEIEYVRGVTPGLPLYNRRLFIATLISCYHIMRETEPLLVKAASKANGDLLKYLEKHLQEEKDHSKWLRDDLSVVGIDPEDLEPLDCVKELVECMHYAIDKKGPAAVLGYMAVLESNPISLQGVEALESLYGEELLRTLRYHVEVDTTHVKELWDVIDQCNEQVILNCASETAYVMKEITEKLGAL